VVWEVASTARRREPIEVEQAIIHKSFTNDTEQNVTCVHYFLGYLYTLYIYFPPAVIEQSMLQTLKNIF
jgi:hypothetical protein